MRRLVVEAPVSELSKFVWESFVKNVESFETLHLLRKDKGEVAMICRVELKDPKATSYRSALKGTGLLEAQLLEREKDGSFVLFIKGRPILPSDKMGFWTVGGYLADFALSKGMFRITFLGSAKEVKAILKFLSKEGIHFKVDLLTDAKFSPDSPLGRLTHKQRKVLTAGFNLGYYDVPRKISSDALASVLKIANPTLVMHSRKAERMILAQILAAV
jgi:hypothetical protein